jgi:hypothetical protein
VDEQKAFTTQHWAFAEARARMVLPVADNFLFVSSATARYEDCPNNTFDWLHTTMHDKGLLFKFDATLFFRTPGFGAIGPTVRIMELPREGKLAAEPAIGLTFGRRVGFFNQNDLLLVNVLTRPGDPSFGFQILRNPIFALVAYRVGFEL